MTDEEKKAIEDLKEVVDLYNDFKSIETVLNLIEKQSKEIEELKNADLTTVYLNGFYDGEKKVKDKIKAKIEEVKDGTYDAKIVLRKKYPVTITKEELEKRWKV